MCTTSHPKLSSQTISVYIHKIGPLEPPQLHDRGMSRPTPNREADKQREGHTTPRTNASLSREEKGKPIVVYNSFGSLHILNDTDKLSRVPKHCSPMAGDPC